MVASLVPRTGDLARNSGMCPRRGWNQRPFDLQAGSQSTELHQPGQLSVNSKDKPEIHFNLFLYWSLIVKSGVLRNFQIAYMKGEKANYALGRQFKDVSCLHKHIRKRKNCPGATETVTIS